MTSTLPSPRGPGSPLVILAGAAIALVITTHAGPAGAHTIVGNRVFPVTLAIDDPGVNDELALPTFSYLQQPNGDGTFNRSYAIQAEYSKTLTSDLAVSIGSAANITRNPSGFGFDNIETGLKYVLYQNADHEFIVSTGVGVEIGGTGSPQSASIPSDPYSTVTASLYAGKGFGDLGTDWLRPFAVTGYVGYSIPTVTFDPRDGSQVPNNLIFGGTLQYSLLYRNSFVAEVPKPFNRLIPAFEGVFTTPISNTGLDGPGTTTGIVGPSLYYMGDQFELGVMAQVPINAASGHHLGVMAVVDFFFDDIFPDSLGKPLFGAPQSRRVSEAH